MVSKPWVILHSQIATRPEYLGLRQWGQDEVWGTWKQFPEGRSQAWRPSGLLDFLAAELRSLILDKFGSLELVRVPFILPPGISRHTDHDLVLLQTLASPADMWPKETASPVTKSPCS